MCSPPIKKLHEKKPRVKQMWFADDVTAASKLQAEWW